MLQVQICKHERSHTLDNYGSADGDARVVATLGGELAVFAIPVGCFLRLRNRRRRLERKPAFDIGAIADAADASACIVRAGAELAVFKINFVVVFAAVHSRCSKTASDFKTLACRDAEHCLRKQCVEPVENGLAKCHRDVAHNELHRAANAVGVLLRVEHFGFHLGAGLYIGAAHHRCFHRFVREFGGIELRAVHLADGIHPGDKFCAGNMLQQLHGHCACTHAPDGFARRAPAAPAVVAEAVLQVVAQVGMPGAVPLCNLGVVAAMLVFVEHRKRYGRTRSLALEHAAQYAHPVFFLAGGGRFVLARPAPIQQDLDVFFGEGEASGATVKDRANGRSVRFAPGSYGKYFAKCARHASKYR